MTSNPLSCKTSFERMLGELPCLCSMQDPDMFVSLSVSCAVQADLRWVSDERKRRWRRRRPKEQPMGALYEIMRQGKGKGPGLQSTKRRSMFEDEATQRSWSVRSTCMDYIHALSVYSNVTLTSMQHASMLWDAVTAAQLRFLATDCLAKRQAGQLVINIFLQLQSALQYWTTYPFAIFTNFLRTWP